ncbi:MAG: S8 family serine peptidase, partial [Pseudomonadota bacterium]
MTRSRIALLALALPLAAATAQNLDSVPVGPVAAKSVAAASDDALLLRSAVIDPLTQRVDAKGFAVDAASSRYGLIQFEAGTRVSQSAVEALGVDVVDRIPNRAFVVRWDAAGRKALAAMKGVRYVGAFEPAFKLGPLLFDAAKRPANETVSLRIVGFPGEGELALVTALRKQAGGVQVTHAETVGNRAFLRLTVEAGALQPAVRSLTAIEGVYFVDEYIAPTIDNADSVGVVQANADSGGTPPTATPIWDQDIIGTGQVVAVFDSGVDRNQAFFARLDQGAGASEPYTDAEDTLPPIPGNVFPDRKIYGYFVQPDASAYDDSRSCAPGAIGALSFHGTHVAGSVAGDAGTPSSPTEPNYDEGDGMAPNAQILVMDIGNDETGCLEGISLSMYEQALRAGASIHSNSFGGSVVGGNGQINEASLIYNGFDFGVDLILRDFEDILYVKSAGNDGSAGLTTLSHPAFAKNGLAVAALQHGNDPSVAGFSSRGPTFDGRVKPDIGAPGVNIVSAAGNDLDAVPPPGFRLDAVNTLSGTSMAAPTVSGSAALARQYYTDGFYPSGSRAADDAVIPSGALLKATLLNGTRLYPDTPAPDSGWGRVWLDNNLYFTGDARDLRVWDLANLDGLRTGEIREFSVEVPAGEEFRATLTWYDPPGSLLTSGRVLVNDLDLEVVTPSGTFLGNQFAGGVSVAGGSRDTIDNTEQVILTSPEAGRYTVRVSATDVPGNGDQNTDLQGFALAVSKAQCDSGVSSAPGVDVTALSDSISLGITAATGAEDYQVYRAVGSCATPAGQFEYVGSTGDLAFEDLRTQGGFEYAYKVRGVDACGEGPLSQCKAAVSTAACTLLPQFDQRTVSVALPGDGTCAVDVAWAAGASSCPGAGISYSVYRSTDPRFQPGPDTLVASGITETSFTDISVDSLATYYYTVRAEDGTGDGAGPNFGNESTGQIRYQITTIGADRQPGEFVDDPDELTVVSFGEPWQLTTQAASTGSFSYHNAEDGGIYPPDTCARIVTPPMDLQDAPVLSYDARFELEADWDGVIVEISNDGGQTWQALPPDQGYPGDLRETEINGSPINACGYPASTRAFNGIQETFRNYSSDLAGFAGQTVQIRWSFTSDPGLEFEGFYLDNIRVSNASKPGECTLIEGAGLDVNGPWFNSDQPGHGWLVEQLEPVAEGAPDRIN